MDWKIFLTTFGTIFLAELGDKTQLATIMMTSKTKLPLSVFTGASLALCLLTLVGVLFGEGLIAVIPQNILKKGAGRGFHRNWIVDVSWQIGGRQGSGLHTSI
jgi:putative Ca2+/H+ antiporter (TMEM165/GDT1 family)